MEKGLAFSPCRRVAVSPRLMRTTHYLYLLIPNFFILELKVVLLIPAWRAAAVTFHFVISRTERIYCRSIFSMEAPVSGAGGGLEDKVSIAPGGCAGEGT